MPKVPTTATLRRSLSPVLKMSDRQLHKLFNHLLGAARATTEQAETIDDSSDEPQSSPTPPTRRKKNMVTQLLDLGNKTGSDSSAETTQAKKKFIVDLLKHGKPGKSKRTSDKSSGSSSSHISDAYSSCSSPDGEDAGLNVPYKEDNNEDPLAASVPTLPSNAPDDPSVELPPSCSNSDAAAQPTTPKETKAKVEKGVTTLDSDDHPVEVLEKAASKKRSSSKGQQSINKDALESTFTTIDPSPIPVPAPAPASAPVSASAPASDPISVPDPAAVSSPASAPVSAPFPVSDPVPAPDASEPIPTPSTPPAFPFNHFPPNPRRAKGTRKGLRRENAFYHKSHYEIAWVPEFGPRDAPPQTLEDVLPPWDPSFRSASAGTSSAMPALALAHPPQLSTPAAAYPSPVESPPSAPAAVPFADGSTSPSARSSRARRGTAMKRGREPEDENIKPAVDEERPMARRRRVGLNKAVGV